MQVIHNHIITLNFEVLQITFENLVVVAVVVVVVVVVVVDGGGGGGGGRGRGWGKRGEGGGGDGVAVQKPRVQRNCYKLYVTLNCDLLLGKRGKGRDMGAKLGAGGGGGGEREEDR